MAHIKTIQQVFVETVGKSQAALTGECPHCGVNSLFHTTGSVVGQSVHFGDQEKGLVEIKVFECHSCSGVVVGAAYPKFGAFDKFQNIFLWPMAEWPNRAPAELDHEIRRDYDEARCTIGLSPRAGAVFARRCLQHVIRKKMNITKKQLVDEIEEAELDDRLTMPVRSALHAVRKFGNIGAHPEYDDAMTLIDVEPEEAAYTLEAVELLFRDLYEIPRKADEMTARLQQKKGNKTTKPS